MPELDAAAPAQPAAPLATAIEQAIANDDTLAYRDARRAERDSKITPVATAAAPPVDTTSVEPPPAPAPAQPDAKELSKRQQKINDYERQLAELRIENARLKTPPPPPAPAQGDRTTPASLTQTIDRPNVAEPPLTETAFYTQHPDATMGDYADYRSSYRIAHARYSEGQARAAEVDRVKGQEQLSKAKASLDARLAANPALKEKIAPLFDPNSPTALRTREQVQQLAQQLRSDPQFARAYQEFNQTAAAQGRRPVSLQIGPVEDFTSELVQSPHFGAILEHLADHPDVLDAVRQLESRSAVARFLGRLESQCETQTPAAASVAKLVSDAPTPPPTLGTRHTSTSDPVAAAVKDDDVRSFRAARLAQRVATHRR